MRRILISLALVAVIALTSVAAMCNRQTFISNAHAAAASYRDAQPLFAELGIPTTRLTQVVGIADELVTAFEQDNNERAIDLVASLISKTNQIISEDVSIIKDETKRVRVMAVLALSNIALHWISANLIKQADTAVAKVGKARAARAAAVTMDGERTRSINAIRDFASAPTWGYQYVR